MISHILNRFKVGFSGRRWTPRIPYQNKKRGGFTLIELLVASLLVSIVILVSWSGLISLMNMSAVAEAKSARQLEVNRASDFITEELRQAKYINTDGISIVDGTTTEIVDLLNNQGFDRTKLGNYGDLALYLEIPAGNPPPLTCPAGGPNAGSPPPSPSTFDQVIYDVRASSSEWLAPRTIMRYGRVHDFNSSFNPCDSPVASDPIADALTDDEAQRPSCSGTLTGGAGFYTCGEENQIRLVFQSTLVDLTVQEVSSNVTSRVQSIGDSTIPPTDCANAASFRSLNRASPVSIEFENISSDTVQIIWIDESGTQQLYAVLMPGEKYLANTYKTHPWVVADDEGTCMSVFVPEEDSSKVFIANPS